MFLKLAVVFLIWRFSVAFVLTNDQVDPLKVNLSLYIESLCDDCRIMLHQQVGPVYSLVEDILNFELVPYGNADETQNPDGSWNFTCQNGEQECTGNLVETCALRLVPDMKVVLPFVICLEDSLEPDTQGPQCASTHGIDYGPIQECVTSDQGNQWQHENAVKTEQLNPPQDYVPWVVVNGVHTEDIQTKAEANLLKLICDTYTGKPPVACNETWIDVDSNFV